ncbi:hypothetical protein SAMN05444507_112146 [Pseudomonas syringae]|uniref:hypothetical protein n=1 Tax=Pseudomonas syringae TaxID=317 RepID=UPI0007EE6A5B|nr:hypothetical protein [Pseudomonas syringae]OBS37848.1 hypothetical protein A9K79_20190 [Pseudomonas syringae pv. syringae]SFI90240.1 hypothetical protein SAMN05444507_112146 [Pseudomonas syringae]
MSEVKSKGFIDALKVEIKKEVLSDGGLRVSFIDEGKSCLAVELTDPRPKSFGEMQLIIKDLELCCASISVALGYVVKAKAGTSGTEVLDFSIQNIDHVIMWNCYSAAIITYGKCFTDTKGRFAKFPEQKLSEILGSDKEVHDRIMHLRHNWIAHGGITNNEYGKAVLLLDPDRDKDPSILYHAPFAAFANRNELEDFLRVAVKCLNFLLGEQARKSQEWFDKDFRYTDLEEHYRNAEYNLNYRHKKKS